MATLYLTMYGDRDFRLLLTRPGGDPYEIGVVRQKGTGTPVIHPAIVPMWPQNLLARLEIARLEGLPTPTRVETVAHIMLNAMASVVNARQLGDPIPAMVQKTIAIVLQEKDARGFHLFMVLHGFDEVSLTTRAHSGDLVSTLQRFEELHQHICVAERVCDAAGRRLGAEGFSTKDKRKRAQASQPSFYKRSSGVGESEEVYVRLPWNRDL